MGGYVELFKPSQSHVRITDAALLRGSCHVELHYVGTNVFLHVLIVPRIHALRRCNVRGGPVGGHHE